MMGITTTVAVTDRSRDVAPVERDEGRLRPPGGLLDFLNDRTHPVTWYGHLQVASASSGRRPDQHPMDSLRQPSRQSSGQRGAYVFIKSYLT